MQPRKHLLAQPWTKDTWSCFPIYEYRSLGRHNGTETNNPVILIIYLYAIRLVVGKDDVSYFFIGLMKQIRADPGDGRECDPGGGLL